MILFEDVHYDKEHDVIGAKLSYNESGLVFNGNVWYKENAIKEKMKSDKVIPEGFHHRQILKALICLYVMYKDGEVKEGGTTSVTWG